MEIWPWAFIIGITLRPVIKYSNSQYHLAPPPLPYMNQTNKYKPLPIFTPQKSYQNTRVFC